MAAGLGFKDFVTGEVLTAADVDGYLMQGTWVFANAAARTAAVTSPQEGNMSYLKDTNSTEYYSGSAWVAVGASGGMTLIQEQTASANSAIDFTSISATYKQLYLVWSGIYHSTGSTEFGIRLNSDTGSNYMNLGIGFNDGTAQDQRSTDTYIQAIGPRPPFGDGVTSTDLGNTVRGQLLIDNYSSTTKLKPYSGEWSFGKAGVGSRTVYNLGTYNSTSAISSINIFRITGSATMSNLSNTSIRLYGIS
jgi:hypothetical protein